MIKYKSYTKTAFSKARFALKIMFDCHSERFLKVNHFWSDEDWFLKYVFWEAFFFFCHLIETKMTRRVSFKGIFETNLLSWTKNWYSLFVMSASLITRSFFLFYPALNIWRAHYIPYCTKIQKKDIYIGLEHRNKT